MNFNDLKNKQQAFDDFIVRLQGLELNENELFLKKAHSLSCELWEVANEISYFKYWKVNHRLDPGKLLEELADCLFFQLSLSNDLDIMLSIEPNDYEPMDNHDRFHILNKYSCKLTDKKYDDVMRVTYLEKLHKNYVGLLYDLGIDEVMIKQAYHLKYKKNINRQCEGY